MRIFKIISIAILILFSLVWAQEVEKFDAQKQKDFLKLIPEKDKEGIISALEDAAGNYKELVNAIQLVDEDKREDMIWLIQKIPHLDRLTITSDILLEHLQYAYESKSRFRYEVPEELFRDFILTYRIGSEPVQKWRKKLFEIFYPRVKDKTDPSEAARVVNHWIKKNIEGWLQRFENNPQVQGTATAALTHLKELESSTRRFQEMFDKTLEKYEARVEALIAGWKFADGFPLRMTSPSNIINKAARIEAV